MNLNNAKRRKVLKGNLTAPATRHIEEKGKGNSAANTINTPPQL